MLSVANKPIMLSVVMLNVVLLNVVMLNIIMLNVIMLNFIILNAVMLNVIMLSVVMLSVILLNAVRLSVAAPAWKGLKLTSHLFLPFFNATMSCHARVNKTPFCGGNKLECSSISRINSLAYYLRLRHGQKP